MSGGKRLGRQAPAVLSAPRRAPSVLTKSVSDAGLNELRASVMARRRELDKLTRERATILGDLGVALDGWEAVASLPDMVKIEELRRRWGIEGAAPAEQSDLTDATAER